MQQRAAKEQQFQASWSLYTHLIALGLALVVPVVALSAILLLNNHQKELQAFEQRVDRIANEVAVDLDQELSGLVVALEVLAISPVLLSGDAEAFRSFASKAGHKHRVHLVLRDPTGQRRFNTRIPPEAPLPRSVLPSLEHAEMTKGRPYVTSIFLGVALRREVFLVSVPVTQGPFAGYTLNASVAPERMRDVFRLSTIPPNWGVEVRDRNQRQVVSQGPTSDLKGRPASMSSSTAGGSRNIIKVTLPGSGGAILGIARARVSGWEVWVVAPTTGFSSIAARSFGWLGLLALGLIATSLALASGFGRVIARPVERLARHAEALGSPVNASPITHSHVREINDVMHRLEETSERLRASTAELRHSEERYRQLATLTPAGLFRLDAAGCFTHVNERWFTITGYTGPEIIGRPWAALLPPGERPRIEARWPTSAAEVRPLQAEMQIVRKDGRLAWLLCEIVAEPVADAGRRGYAGSLIDVTDQHTVEQLRRQTEDRLQLALELGRMGTAAWDPSTGLIELDAIGFEMLGRTPTAMPLSISGLMRQLHRDDRATVMAFNERLMAGDEPQEVVCRVARPDGSIRWLAVRGHQDRGPRSEGSREGLLPRMVGVLFDVTDQKHSERALEERVQQRTRELEAANARLSGEIRQRVATEAALSQAQKLEALGQLTSSVAHDFNYQLMAILGGLELLEKRADDEPSLRLIRNARSAAQRAGQLTDQLLIFARRPDLEPLKVDVAETLDGLDVVFRHAAGSSISRSFDIPAELWPVWADPGQLEATLLNIIVNARDAMEDDGRLSIAARNVAAGAAGRPQGLPDGDFVAIAVVDDGKGMTPDVLLRAREPFFTTKPRGKGSGLGLAMADSFAERSHGLLHIASSPGRGTTVTIYLPTAHDQTRAQGPAPTSASSPVAPDLAILCVDDDRHAAAMLDDLLRDLGHKDVIVATDPEEALRTGAARDRLDLLVTDIDMPKLDGFAVAQKLRSLFPDLSVLFVTGHGEHAVTSAVEGPSSAVLRKPFIREDLGQRIAELTRPMAGDGTTRSAPGSDATEPSQSRAQA